MEKQFATLTILATLFELLRALSFLASLTLRALTEFLVLYGVV